MDSHRSRKNFKKATQAPRRFGTVLLQTLKKTNQKLRLQILRQQRVGATLPKSEWSWETIFDNAQDGILIVDAARKKIFKCNRKIREMLGYSESEFLSLSVKDIHPPKELERVLTAFRRLVKGKASNVADIPVRRKDGSVFYADVNTSLINLLGKKYLNSVANCAANVLL